MAGDFTGDGHARPGRRQARLEQRVGVAGHRRRHLRGPRTARHHPVCHAPGGRRHRRWHRRCPGRRRRRGHPLSPGHPRPARLLPAARHGQPRHHPSRDIAWLPDTDVGPVLASVDAQDDAISFYAYRDGRFVRLDGSLATGQLPAQIVAAQLDGNGLDDLVVRNAGDGTLSVYLGSWFDSGFVGPSGTLAAPIFTAAFILPVGLGVSDVQAVDTTGSGVLDLVVTNKLTGQVSILRNRGGGLFAAPEPYPAGTGLYAVDTSGGSPVVTSLEATSAVAAGTFTHRRPDRPGDDQLRRRETIGVLAGLGNGRFANPVTFYTGQSRAGGPRGRLQSTTASMTWPSSPPTE